MAINLPIISEWNPAGIDKAIADFKKLETNGERAAFAIKKAAVPAGLAVAALGAVAFDAVKAFAEDDAAAQKLAKTLENTTGATDAQVNAVEDFISKTSVAAAVADDELRPALDSLVRGTGDVAKAQDLLSLALDVSAGTGKDLGAVSDALSKAFNGNLGPLKKLDPALADLIKSGASTDEVFAALGDTFKGQASVAANTAQGKMKNLGIQFGELKESIGEAVMPLAEKLLPKFLAFTAWMQKNKTLIVTIGAVIGGIAIAVIAVNAAMTAWTAVTTAFTAVQAAFNAVMALNPIFLIVIAVAAIIAILVVLQQKFDIFGKAFEIVGDVFNGVWDVIKSVFNWVVDNWPLLLPILLGPFGLIIAGVIIFKDQIMNIIKTVIGWIGTAFGAVKDFLVKPFDLFIGYLNFWKETVIGVFDGIKKVAGGIFDTLGGAFKAIINTIIRGWNKIEFKIPGFKIGPVGFDGFTLGLPDVPLLAEGGIVTTPTLAMIGEAGPEAVIPLNKSEMIGSSPNITINVNGGDPNTIVRALQQYIRDRGALPLTINPTAFRG